MVDATKLTVGEVVKGVKFRFADVWEDVEVDEVFVAVDEVAESEVEVPLEAAVIVLVPEGVGEVEVKDGVVLEASLDAVETETVGITVWETELADGKLAALTTGGDPKVSASERFFRKRFALIDP